MIEECQGTAVILDRDCYGITLSANVIAHNGGGIDLRDAHGCAASANTFTLIKTHALRISAASGRIAVTGNSFCDSFIGDGQVKRAANDIQAGGIVLAGAADVVIDGNTFSGLQPKALQLDAGQPPQRTLFTNNVLVEAPSDHAALQDVSGCLERDNLTDVKP
jgi:hypothetical protein